MMIFQIAPKILKNPQLLPRFWRIIIFSKILKIHHFFSPPNWENSSFYAKILKKSSFFPKILKRASFFPQNLKNYHFYQSLIVSHKYPILVSNSLVSNSIQYWYQMSTNNLPKPSIKLFEFDFKGTNQLIF